MKVAVTGASGFIGQHVVRELRSRGKDPTLLLRQQTKSPCPDSPILPFDLHALPDSVFESTGKPDLLFHLAWGGLPNYRSLHHFEQELPAHYRFLSAMIRGGLRTLVVAGTCFEYGMKSGPLSEDHCPVPDNPYAFAKDSLRRQLQFLQRETHFDLVWTRIFYLHGAGQAASSLRPQLETAVRESQDEFPMSGGEQLRDYLPVSQAAQHLVDLGLQMQNLGIVNICSGSPVSVRSLVESWIDELGVPLKLQLGHYPYPEYEPMAFWGDATRLRKLLNFQR